MKEPIQSHLLSSGSLQLDLSLAQGGIPPGEVVLLHGPLESGKTLLCLKMLVEAGRAAKNTVLIDADNGLEPEFAVRYGADPERLFLCQGIEPGQILDLTQSLLKKNLYSIIAIDSVTDFMDETVDNFRLNQQSLGKALPRLVRMAKENGTVLVFTEHTNPWERRVYHQLANRLEKISLSLHAGIRLEILPVEEQSQTFSRAKWVKITILKGKKPGISPSIRLNIMYNHRNAKCVELLELGVQSGVIQLQGDAYAFGNLLLGSDYQNTLSFLSENLAVTEKIEQDIRNWYD